MKHTRQLATLLLAAALLAGCGQKGPLFIPEKKGEAVAEPAPAPESTVPQQSSNSDADVAAAERARQEAARRAAGN